MKDQRGFTIENDATTLLVRCSLGKRTQTVKVTCPADNKRSFQILKLQSRACLAADYRFVLDALKLNADSEWGGLALDKTITPPAIDVVYNLVADGLHPQAFVTALTRVASFADRIELLTRGSDHF